MLVLGLDLDDLDLSTVYGIADEVMFYVYVPHPLAGMFIVGYLDAPLIVLHDVDGVDLEGRHDESLDLTEE